MLFAGANHVKLKSLSALPVAITGSSCNPLQVFLVDQPYLSAGLLICLQVAVLFGGFIARYIEHAQPYDFGSQPSLLCV